MLLCRKSKRLINIVNRLGLCSSYHDLARIDTGLAKHKIALAGSHRVPVLVLFFDSWDNRQLRL